MPSWTTPAIVIDSWIGDDAPTDNALVQIWIDRAERLIRKSVPTLSDRLDTIPAIVDLLATTQDVVSNMVQRVFRNPAGTRQRSSTTGPFSEQETFGGDQPGYLWITDDEIESLQGVIVGRFHAFQIDPLIGYTYPTDPDAWSEIG